MEFVSAYNVSHQVLDTDIVFVIRGNELLVEERCGQVCVPKRGALEKQIPLEAVQYLGALAGVHCFAGAAPEVDELPSGVRFAKLRGLYGRLTEAEFQVSLRALHLLHWEAATRFCGTCGAPVVWHLSERAKQCPKCNRVVYPVISPATITAVTKGDKLLLLNHHRSPEGLFALLAGFAEPGETLEECVQRETLEEAGIKVRDIQYFGSQPWGFSGALMVGFTAEYESGALVLQESEIRAAGWFTAAEVPTVSFYNAPGAQCSIAWHLIRHFLKTHNVV